MTADPATGQPGQCPSCHEPVSPKDNFCEACGAVLSAAAPSAPPGEAEPDAAVARQDHEARSARDHFEIDLGRVAGVSDRGIRHYRNEDALTVAAGEAASGPVSVAVVCDGVSGSARGDEASQAAADAALTVLEPAALDGRDAAAASMEAVQAAQAAVAGLAHGREEPPTGDAPSATFLSAIITADAVTVCWLGDTRAYWLDSEQGPTARQLTSDDSLAAVLVSAGMLSDEQAATSPQAHMVTGWLGADVSNTAPHLLRFVPPGPGAVLLCTDGLWNYLNDAAALADLALPTAPEYPLGTARMLVDFAVRAGGMDNVTVAIASFPPGHRALQESQTRRASE
jgi:serine/threonine protein phosphatase PrpC